MNSPCTSTESLPWSTTPIRVAGSPLASHIAANRALLGARDRDQHAARGLGEQKRERGCAGLKAVGNDYAATGFASERRFDHRLDQPALGQVVGRGHQPVAGCGDQHVGKQPLPLQVYRRGQPPRWSAVTWAQIDPSNSSRGVAEQDQRFAGLGAESGRNAAGDIVDDTQDADDRRWQDRGRARLVVEADVAAGDRNAECPHSHRPDRGPPRRTATSRRDPPASRN